jgi:FKBP-type peptidyl-prolyl cis-trans isomerase FkpA
MLKTRVLLGLFLMAAVFAACKKPAPYDDKAELGIDDAIIKKYLLDSNVTAIKDSSGLYYNIITPGTGNHVYVDKDSIYAKYRLKILKDSVLRDRSLDSTFVFQLPGYIAGWQIGTRMIQPGGAIRLIIPSALGFKDRAVVSPVIPPNSILDITLEIVSVNKNPKIKK